MQSYSLTVIQSYSLAVVYYQVQLQYGGRQYAEKLTLSRQMTLTWYLAVSEHAVAGELISPLWQELDLWKPGHFASLQALGVQLSPDLIDGARIARGQANTQLTLRNRKSIQDAITTLSHTVIQSYTHNRHTVMQSYSHTVPQSHSHAVMQSYSHTVSQ